MMHPQVSLHTLTRGAILFRHLASQEMYMRLHFCYKTFISTYIQEVVFHLFIFSTKYAKITERNFSKMKEVH